ncbi:MAG: CehA/McbA family metallohydrolase [Acidobacteria bacterium]|nr:CehA/McbA family metallohydrolase [Acidobacteriota bacterium]
MDGAPQRPRAGRAGRRRARHEGASGCSPGGAARGRQHAGDRHRIRPRPGRHRDPRGPPVPAARARASARGNGQCGCRRAPGQDHGCRQLRRAHAARSAGRPGAGSRAHGRRLHRLRPHALRHTLELSGHGDAAVRERILTAAAEALDIVVATEHNRTSDYSQAARELGLERLLLPVRGMEVTTATGHFNVFPLPREAPAPEVRERDWLKLARSIQDMPGGRVIIQNHPRDLHSNYRPFDPSHHLSSAGENLNGRPVFANAMEVVNSGAMHSDVLQPVRDWLGLLNRGYRVAAIGASDTHTVDFVPIGQARTYIDIGGLGPEWRSRQKELFERLARGENLVAYGLAANLRVVHQSRRKLDLEAAVYGPSWSASDRLTIYANGSPAAEQRLPPGSAAGRKWSGRIELDVPHDTIVVAVASGPGVRRPFWEVRKPYQPTGTSWNPRVIGISKAIRVDVDGHGFQSARDYAVRLVEKHGAPTSRLTDDLKAYDDSVVIQVLTLLASSGHKPETLRELFDGQKAYGRFLEEWNRTVPPKSPASGR